jgi:predicted phage terminase large subunit-like protein
LWPEQRGKAWLKEKRRELGEYGYASLIQGRPRPRVGGMFQWDWWQGIAAVPASGRMVRYWDMAGTEPKDKKKHKPDFTAGVLACRMLDERTAFVHMTRFQKSVAQRDAKMEQVCRSDLKKYPQRVVWWIEAEAGIDGERRTTALVKRLQNCGMAVYTEHPTGSKVLRAEPLASKAEVGNVVLCPDDSDEPWHDDFRLEAADFPRGLNDDLVDAADGADAKLDAPMSEVGFTSYSR